MPGFNQGAVNTNTPARAQCFLGGDEGSCGKRLFTFGLDVTRPLNDGTDSYYRGQGAVTFTVIEAPAASNVGPVSTGGGDELSSGMGFVVVREKTQPTVMFPVPGTAGVRTGDDMVGIATSASFASLGVSGPTLAVTTRNNDINT